jgi:hypothetical protein
MPTGRSENFRCSPAKAQYLSCPAFLRRRLLPALSSAALGTRWVGWIRPRDTAGSPLSLLRQHSAFRRWLGPDPSQFLHAQALLRLRAAWPCLVTMGEARREIPRCGVCSCSQLLTCLYSMREGIIPHRYQNAFALCLGLLARPFQKTGITRLTGCFNTKRRCMRPLSVKSIPYAIEMQPGTPPARSSQKVSRPEAEERQIGGRRVCLCGCLHSPVIANAASHMASRRTAGEVKTLARLSTPSGTHVVKRVRRGLSAHLEMHSTDDLGSCHRDVLVARPEGRHPW